MSTIGFSVSDRDTARLNRLVERYGGGNRSAFLRVAMDQMDVIDRADRLTRLQQYGMEKATETGLGPEDAVRIVREIVKRHQVESTDT